MNILGDVIISISVILLVVYTLVRLVLALFLLLVPTTKGEITDYKIIIEPFGWTYYKLRFNRKRKLFWLFSIWSLGELYGSTRKVVFVDEEITPEEMDRWVMDTLKSYEDYLKMWSGK